MFRHDVKRAWDIAKGTKKRTVMYESISISVFKADPEEKEIEVAEFNLLELEGRDDGTGEEEWKLTEARVWMDSSPVVKRMAEISKE